MIEQPFPLRFSCHGEIGDNRTMIVEDPKFRTSNGSNGCTSAGRVVFDTLPDSPDAKPKRRSSYGPLRTYFEHASACNCFHPCHSEKRGLLVPVPLYVVQGPTRFPFAHLFNEKVFCFHCLSCSSRSRAQVKQIRQANGFRSHCDGQLEESIIVK